MTSAPSPQSQDRLRWDPQPGVRICSVASLPAFVNKGWGHFEEPLGGVICMWSADAVGTPNARGLDCVITAMERKRGVGIWS